MIWDFSFFEGVRIWLAIMSVMVLAAVLQSNKMKIKNKYIFASIGILLILSFPFTRRMEIRNYVEEKGYTLLVDQTIMFEHYGEADLTDYLWKPFLRGFYLNHENKLILIYYEKTAGMLPQTLEDIAFSEK